MHLILQMGISSIFTDSADFSHLLSNGNADKLTVSKVIHKTVIKVNEQGTLAASATGIQLETISAYIGPITEFKADHPFFYMLIGSDKSILFAGDFVGTGNA